jgi:large subunit ribosomal protein L25
LDIGDSIHAGDIELPEGILILSDAHLTLVSVVPPIEEKPATEEPAAAPEVEVATKKGKAKTEAEG